MPKIKDIAVVCTLLDHYPIGEAPRKGQQYLPMTADHRLRMHDRLLSGVSKLMDLAHTTHLANNKVVGTEEVDPNYITRLSTNEFYFYTQEPLTLSEFEKLQDEIARQASSLPPGIHLALGSFAVKTPDNRVMNVTPHIASGKPPSCSFLVKNHTSPIDYGYEEANASGLVVPLPVFDARTESASLPQINVNDALHSLTFNNVVPCKTPGGDSFLTTVDICLDHLFGVAAFNIEALVKKEPAATSQPISHLLLSNYIAIHSHASFGSVMHADPVHSHKQCKQDASQVAKDAIPFFGEDENKIYEVSSMPCPKLDEARDVLKERQMIFALSNIPPTKYLPGTDIFLSVTNKLGDTPLHLALQKGYDPTVLLTNPKADSLWSTRNAEGNTPAHIAADIPANQPTKWRCDTMLSKMVNDPKANSFLDITNNNGHTAQDLYLSHALSAERSKAVGYLNEVIDVSKDVPDKHRDAFHRSQSERIQAAKSLEALEEIQTNLQRHKNSVTAINVIIEDHRKNAVVFLDGMKNKAQNIQEKLSQIPMEQRHKISEQSTPETKALIKAMDAPLRIFGIGIEENSAKRFNTILGQLNSQQPAASNQTAKEILQAMRGVHTNPPIAAALISPAETDNPSINAPPALTSNINPPPNNDAKRDTLNKAKATTKALREEGQTKERTANAAEGLREDETSEDRFKKQ